MDRLLAWAAIAVGQLSLSCHVSETYAPCDGKAAGEPCTLCAPDDASCVETQQIKTCNDTGQCGVASGPSGTADAGADAYANTECTLAGGTCIATAACSTGYVADYSLFACTVTPLTGGVACCFSADGGVSPRALDGLGKCDQVVCPAGALCYAEGDGGTARCSDNHDSSPTCGVIDCGGGCACASAAESRCACQ